MAEHLPNVWEKNNSYIDSKFVATQLESSTTKHIIINQLKIKDEVKCLKVRREKKFKMENSNTNEN